MTLSVLSALARLDVDPWEEAVKLSELPKNTATQRLASLIAQLPGGQWTQADSRAIAVRLIELLPRRGSSKEASTAKTHGFREMSGSAKMLICAALGAIALIIAASHEPSPRSDHIDPAFNTASPNKPVWINAIWADFKDVGSPQIPATQNCVESVSRLCRSGSHSTSNYLLFGDRHD